LPKPGCTLLCFHSVNCLSALPSVKTSVYLQSVLTEKLKSTTSRPPSQSLTCAAMNVPLTTVPPTLLNPISLLLLAKTAPSASGYIYYSSVLYKPSFFFRTTEFQVQPFAFQRNTVHPFRLLAFSTTIQLFLHLRTKQSGYSVS
jgi:hypothetical protein